MKWKKAIVLLFSALLLSLPLSGCSQAQPEPVFPELDTAEILYAEVPYRDSVPQPLSQEDLEEIVTEMQGLEGVYRGSTPPETVHVATEGVPMLRLCLMDGRELSVSFLEKTEVNVILRGDIFACYEVPEEELAPLREIICSHFSPQPSQPE